ncbi:MAG: serine/threonine protein kinase, partial [Polyangiaceae bacterium]|nr:serine/threonine protein kinase [Polyangiaceae bacterium]
MNMEKDTLCSELERLFSLEELTDMTRNFLGMSPDDVGDAGKKSAFAKALVDRCENTDQLEALFDVVLALRSDADSGALQKALQTVGAEQELQPGATLGTFAIRRKLGSGQHGSVYLVKQGDKDLLLKVLRPGLGHHRSAFARYQAAVRLLGQVQDEGLPTGMVTGIENGLGFFAYDNVEGQSIAARIARSGPMHINEAKAFVISILQSLAAIHAKHVAHGNLKLTNLLVTRGTETGKQRIVLLDPAVDRLHLHRPVPSNNDVVVVVGDSKAIAPEQWKGVAANPRTDVYCFGALVYELLTGKCLFPTESGFDYALAQLTRDPEPANVAAPRGWVSKDVSDFVMSLLARNPSDRPANAAAVLEAFENIGRVGAPE